VRRGDPTDRRFSLFEPTAEENQLLDVAAAAYDHTLDTFVRTPLTDPECAERAHSLRMLRTTLCPEPDTGEFGLQSLPQPGMSAACVGAPGLEGPGGEGDDGEAQEPAAHGVAAPVHAERSG
jgi:hypothetical protein